MSNLENKVKTFLQEAVKNRNDENLERGEWVLEKLHKPTPIIPIDLFYAVRYRQDETRNLLTSYHCLANGEHEQTVKVNYEMSGRYEFGNFSNALQFVNFLRVRIEQIVKIHNNEAVK